MKRYLLVLLTCALLIGVCGRTLAAFTASAVLEVRTTGSDTQGGGVFDSGVTPGFTTLGITLATSAAPVVAITGEAASDVNAWFYLKSGTSGTPGWYQITAVDTSAHTYTLNATKGQAVLANGTLSTAQGCGTAATLANQTGTVDYSQQDTYRATGTVTSSTTTVTATTSIFTKQMVGDCITDGTTYRIITAYTSGTVVTVDAAPAWTAATVYVGGGFASPGKVEALVVAGNNVFYKSGTYTISSTSSNVAGGTLNLNVSGTATARIRRRGYNALRGDIDGVMNATRPTFQVAASGVTSVTIVNFNNANSYNSFENVVIDGQNKTSILALQGNGRCNYALKLKITSCGTNATQHATAMSNNFIFLLSEITSCTTGNFASLDVGSTSCQVFGCTVHDGTGRGIDVANTSGSSTVAFCNVYNQAGANGYGFNLQGSSSNVYLNCTAYNCAQDGFYVSNTSVCGHFINCIGAKAGGYNFNSNAAGNDLIMQNCAGWVSGGSGNVNTGTSAPLVNEAFITLASSPFINAAGANFALNTVSNGGALCRAAGIPGSFPGLTSTSGYLDIGAVQSNNAPRRVIPR